MNPADYKEGEFVTSMKYQPDDIILVVSILNCTMIKHLKYCFQCKRYQQESDVLKQVQQVTSLSEEQKGRLEFISHAIT
jgi:hypothetical protein